MKQTAVDFLKEKLTYVFVNDKSFNEIFEQAKAMEKEQIIEAYRTGVEEDVYLRPLRTGEHYYDETFNQ